MLLYAPTSRAASRGLRWTALGIILALLSLGLASSAIPPQGKKARTAKDDSSGYFKKWIKEDVVYIISEEEKDIFVKLTTDEEGEQFIEQFWRRRDPFTAAPSLAVSYSVRPAAGGSVLFSQSDEQGNLIHYHSPQRVVLLGNLPLEKLPPGSYRLELEVRDCLGNGSASTTASFHITAIGLPTKK